MKPLFNFNVIFRRIENLMSMESECVTKEDWLHEICAYRAFQLTVRRYNDCMRGIFIAVLLTSGISQIESFFMLVGLTAQMPITIKIFFIVLAIETFIIHLVIYGFLGDIHYESLRTLSVLTTMVKRNHKRHRQHLETFINSCLPERVQFGLSNFIEKTTPLVFQMFCVGRIIDLLLLTK